MLRGEDPFAVERIVARLSTVEHNYTAKGAVDIALHDIMGQAAGVPCYRLLGGWHDEAQVIYVVGGGTPDAMLDECRDLQARCGITAFKLKVGLDLRKDMQMLSAVRKGLPDATLGTDGRIHPIRHFPASERLTMVRASLSPKVHLPQVR